MTDDAMSRSAPYLQIWAEAMAQAMSEIAGAACPCAVLDQSPTGFPTAKEDDLWVVVACSGHIRGEMSLRIPAASTLRLAQTFMSEPPSPSAELTGEHREAILELLRQVGGLAATAIKAAQGEVQFRLEAAASSPTWPPSSIAWLRIGEEASPLGAIELQMSAALVAGLRPEAAEPARSESQALENPPSSPGDGKVSLNLLMDVELGVVVRFGSRRLLLREVLDLNPGSVISLDRQVQEPADLLLDGRVLASGEVVVVDGNYGFRVTETGPAAN